MKLKLLFKNLIFPKKMFIILCIITFVNNCNRSNIIIERKIIILQPFEDFSITDSKYIMQNIQKYFKDIYLNDKIDLPQISYYKPRNRYRADIIIRYLSDLHSSDTITVGLTNYDISTTKNGVKDWGVMGLGYRPGNSCVISTFRLNKKNKKEQVIKVVLHEIGHTLNLPHCANKECLMRDAEGGNPLDDEKDYCNKCKNKLNKNGLFLQNESN